MNRNVDGILPCPFCGFDVGKAFNFESQDISYPVSGNVWQFGCNATIGGCDATMLGVSEKDAIKNWNKRA
ncbi:hypothetical protein Xoosp13_75 [Xanthomonas phage Xoo-sp13]|nr:hypothetical protein Xoosp13_75 [Xanthomonas phage Xoo-sp13]